MAREIHLDGGETTLLKAIGMGGAPIQGKLLASRMKELEDAEFLDALVGLIDLDYVLASKVNIRLLADVEHASFRINPAYARGLREAVNPSRNREQQRARRQRRR